MPLNQTLQGLIDTIQIQVSRFHLYVPMIANIAYLKSGMSSYPIGLLNISGRKGLIPPLGKVISSAQADGVGASKRPVRVISTWSTARIRAKSCIASRECPPNSKKL